MSRLTKLFVLLLVAEAIVIGIRFWNRTPLPEVPWDQLDPAVAAEIRVIEDSLNPRQAADWSEMGDVYRTFGLFPQASHCYGKASALQPENPYNAYTWAICRELMGEIRPAIELFQRAKAGFDVATGDPNAPAFSAYSSLNIGQCLLKEGRLVNAEQALKEALPLPKAGLLLGRIFARTGRAGEATTILSDVLKEYPDDLTANLLMSYAEAELGRGTSALDYRERALRGSPIIPVWDITYPAIRKRRENMGTLGWFARSQAMLAKGNLAGAMEESKRALDTLWTEDYALLLARQHLIKGDVPAALTLVTNCFKTVGASPGSLGILGSALAQSGKADEARSAWKQACDMGGDFHAEIAELLEKSGLKDAAAMERGLALFVRGKSAFLRNDLSGALRDLEPAAKAAPESAIVWFYLAEARRFTGERDGARDAYERCLKLQPNHGRAFAALQKLPAR